MSLSRSHPAKTPPRDSQLPAPLGADPTYFLPKVESGRIMGALLRRSWMVVLSVVLGMAAMWWLAGRMPKTYRASGSVYVASQAPVVLDIRAVAPEETRDLEQMRSVEQGMSASTLLMRIIEKHGLGGDPDFARPGAGPQTMLAKLSSRISIGLRRGTRIIDISVDDTNPERARDLVQALVDEYETLTTQRQQSITEQASEGLAREEVRLRKRMEESALKLQEFRESHPVPGLESAESGGPVRDMLSTLNAQLTQVTAERLRLESEFEACVKFDPTKPEAVAGIEKTERGTEVLAQVRAIQLKEAEFSILKERYLYKHPLYREAANEIEVLKANLADTVKAATQALEQRYAIVKENETKLAAQVAQARGSAVEDEGVREEFRAMARAAEADRTLHDSVMLRLRETNLAATVPASVLRWEDSPLVPEKPHSPRKIIFAGVGGFLGFLAGAILLVAAEVRDRKVRNAAAAVRATGTPLLATLPALDNPAGMLLMSDPESAGAEAFRRLRVVLGPQNSDSTGRTVLFASARAGEGKSLCALNHATALAMQGHRTLLLDADLRSPGLSREHVTRDGQEGGLGGFLDGKSDPASCCYATSLPNLYLLSSGPMRGDAAELLAGTRFPSLLEDAFRWFDRVVIDSPSVLSVSDALSVARYADRCCLVIREGGSDRRELKRAAELLRSSGGNLIGLIWNESSKDAKSGKSGIGPAVPANRLGLDAPQPVGVDSAPPIDTMSVLASFA